MRVGIAYDLKSDYPTNPDAPQDLLEEYDSPETIAALVEALHSLGHEPVPLGGGPSFLQKILSTRVELVFNLAEGRQGFRSREAHIPAVLELLGIPYTGSDPLTLALTLEKSLTLKVVASAGVPTPHFTTVNGADSLTPPFSFPLIAKPVHEGSSMGLRRHSKILTPSAYQQEIQRLRSDYHQPILVQEFLEGPEYTIGILGNGKTARVLGIMEIHPKLAPVPEFVYSIEVKRNFREEVEYRVNNDLPRPLRQALETFALTAYQALGCRDVARMDFRLSSDGTPRFLEVNPLPGLHPVTSDLPIMAYAVGLSYQDLIGEILHHARGRYG